MDRRPGLAFVCAVVSLHAVALAAAPTPPSQPAAGPGSSEYTHHAIEAKYFGEGADAYWLFEPADPKPERAPVIVFSHGWGAMQPKIYGAWIDHLVRRGNIVIYPLYQDSLRTPVHDFTSNTIAGVTDALHRLQNEPGHVKPDLDKVAYVGHSMGGVLSANLAALAESSGLPKPRAVMCVQPGKTWAKSPNVAVQLEDMGRIPADTLLLTIVGDNDKVARDVDAKRIFHEAAHVPLDHKDYVTLVSDDHGEPALNASHGAPAAFGGDYTNPDTTDEQHGALRERLRERIAERREDSADEQFDLGNEGNRPVDALDYFGTWKLLDGLTDAAFFGKNREYALGDTPEQRFMGRWSDGEPVKELIVTDEP